MMMSCGVTLLIFMVARSTARAYPLKDSFNAINVVVLNDLSMSFEGSVENCSLHQKMVADTLQKLKSFDLTNATYNVLRLGYIEFGHVYDYGFDTLKFGTNDLNVITPLMDRNDPSIPDYNPLLTKVCDGVVNKRQTCEEEKVHLYEAIQEGLNQMNRSDSVHNHFFIFSNCKPSDIQQKRICNRVFVRDDIDVSATMVNVGPEFDQNGEFDAIVRCLVETKIFQSKSRETIHLRRGLQEHLRRRLQTPKSTSIGPTKEPTVSPTLAPTSAPTVDPTIDPTIDPTSFPTTSPISYPNCNYKKKYAKTFTGVGKTW
eukprot:253260_1